jgi:CheY-like chemotaxis protein
MLQSLWMHPVEIELPKPPRIALVEDSPADAHIMRFALQQTGRAIDIEILDDGSKAIEYLCNANGGTVAPPCDLVLLDLNLPGISGFEVLECIKTNHHMNTVPVVVMSGSVSREDIERSYKAGANSYISKPAQLEDLLILANRLVAYWFDCAKLPSQNR